MKGGDAGYDEYDRKRADGAYKEKPSPLASNINHSPGSMHGAIGGGITGTVATSVPYDRMYVGGVGSAGTKASNPKADVGATKVPLHLVPPVVKAYLSVALHLGWTKYGAWNWRAAGVSMGTYRAACERHMDRWWEGEELDPADGTPHLANALACIAILIEGQHRKNITDDRPPSTDLGPVYEQLEAMMKVITLKYADKKPRHYVKADEQFKV